MLPKLNSTQGQADLASYRLKREEACKCRILFSFFRAKILHTQSDHGLDCEQKIGDRLLISCFPPSFQASDQIAVTLKTRSAQRGEENTVT